MTDTAAEQLTPQQKAAATRAAKKAEAEAATAQAAFDALSDDDKAALAALTPDELAELAALAAAPAAPAAPPAPPADDSDPNVGVFVGYGATCHGTEGGMYAVDPDTGLTTGPFVPDDDAEQ